ncbi:MAG: hypothetical protein GF411_00500 [Candidatus Lokiarchaeota archaeon]|nr:hypothetical protein [Candidatus Lokiarchaeota archaeon]
MKARIKLLILSVLCLAILNSQQFSLVSAIAPPPPPGGGTTYRMYGYIKQSGTGAPISGALVKFYGSGYNYLGQELTDSNGYFNYYKSLSMSYSYVQIRVTKSGYNPVQKNAYLSSSRYYFGSTYMTRMNSYHVHGIIKDDGTNSGVGGVQVKIYGSLVSSSTFSYVTTKSTSSDGSFSYSFYSNNDYDYFRIDLSKDGYSTKIKYQSVTASECDFGIVPFNNIARKLALVIGISDYQESSITDLNYCDDDANDWYTYLTQQGSYDLVYVLGDATSSYIHIDGIATEANIKQYISNMISIADYNDELALIFSGFGVAHSTADVGFAAYDYDGNGGELGLLNDHEFNPLLDNFDGTRINIFFDFGYSGGMLDDLESTSSDPEIYVVTAVGEIWNANPLAKQSIEREGIYPFTENGCWTWYFLHQALISQGITDWQDAYDAAMIEFDADWTTHMNGPMMPREFLVDEVEKIAVFWWSSIVGNDYLIQYISDIMEDEGYTIFYNFKDTHDFTSDFNQVESYEDANDIIFIYITGHGFTNLVNSYVEINADLFPLVLASDVFRSNVDRLDSNRVGVLVDSCFSGCWVTNMIGSGCLMISSADQLHFASGTSDNIGTFTYFFYPPIDNDGMNALEAFNIACDQLQVAQGSNYQNPQYINECTIHSFFD